MSLSTTSVPEVPGERPAPARRAVAIFTAAVILGIGLGAFLLLMGPVQGFLRGLKGGAPPSLQPHVDALLVPFWAGFVAASLIGLATSVAPPVLQRWPSTRAALAWTCVILGVAGCGLMYWWGGYVLPYASRRALFGPGGMYRYSADFPPYLLTNEELAHVQAFLRRQGGYSPRVALMWQLRMWCALILPVAGLLAAVAVIRLRSGLQLAWLFGSQVAIAGLWLIGTMVAVGPASFARPTAVPQRIAWAILVAAAAIAVIVFRRTLAALEAAEYQQVLDALEDQSTAAASSIDRRVLPS